MRNMVCKYVGGVGIAVHTTQTPSDAEWRELMNDLKTRDLDNFRGLTFTDGGAPSSTQRKQLNDLVAGRAIPTAIISANPLVRGVVTALSWFNPLVKVFTPDQLNEALSYLEVDEYDATLIRVEIRMLRAQLGDDSLEAIAPDF